MVRKVSDMQLQLAQAKGAQVSRPPMNFKSPELVAIMEKFFAMKQENSAKHEAKWKEKLAKMDEMIAAVKAIKIDVPKGTDLGPVMKLLAQIQKDHSALMSKGDDDDNDAPCAYKVTGKRDQRGLIDLEAGLVFTPMKGDE